MGWTRASSPPVRRLGDRQELDPVAQLPRVGDLLGADPGDALGVDLLQLHPAPEGERGEDLELVGRVDALDVQRRVRLGVPGRLRFAEGLGEVAPLLGHPRQDVVRRPVDDAVERDEAVGGQAVAEGPDDRHPAGHRGLEAEQHPAAPGRLEQLRPVGGHQRLVGRDHVLAGGDRPEDERPGRLEPADQLDDDRGPRVGEDALHVGGERPVAEREPRARRGDVAVGDGGDGQAAAGLGLQAGPVLPVDLEHAAADGPDAEEPDADVAHSGPPADGLRPLASPPTPRGEGGGATPSQYWAEEDRCAFVTATIRGPS